MIDFLNNFSLDHPWIPMAIGIYLLVVKFVQGLRDALDKTPETDDNAFERAVTVLVKVSGYFVGIRPSAPKGAIPAVGEVKDATGVKVDK